MAVKRGTKRKIKSEPKVVKTEEIKDEIKEEEPSDYEEEEILDYEQQRLQNIAERQSMFDALKVNKELP